MADELFIKVKAKLDESSVGEIQSQLDNIGKGKKEGIKLQLDKSINTQIGNLKSKIDTLISKPYQIKFQIDQSVINSIQNLANNLNQAISNAQSKVTNLSQQAYDTSNTTNNKVNAGSDGLASISSTFLNGKLTREVSKFNEELGKTKTVIDDVTSGSRTEIFSTSFEKQNKEIEKTLNDLTTYYNKLNDLENKAFGYDQNLKGTKFESGIVDQINTIRQALNEMQSAANGKDFVLSPEYVRDLSIQFNTLKNTISSDLSLAFPKTKNGQSDVASQIETLKNQLDAYKTSLANFEQLPESIKTKFGDLSEMLNLKSKNGAVDGLNDYISQFRLLKSEVDKFNSEQKAESFSDKFKIDEKILNAQFDNIKKKYQEIVSTKPGLANDSIEAQIERVQNALDNVNPQNIATVKKEIQLLRTEINGLQPQTLGQVLQQNLGSIGQYLARFTSAAFVIQNGIQITKQMISEVTAVDSSLVELQKVTTLSGEALDQFVDKAYDVGKGLGRTGKDVMDAVTTFSRAGYDLQEATNLAQSALVMSNVGVDIPNMESAASDMISILKAFDIQADESMHVIDKLYNVANKEPLDFGNITDMLVTAGGILAQTGTSLDQTMGLLTGAFATLRDNSVANGLIMISQRLRGVKEDGEAIEEAGFMPKLKTMFADIGIDIEDQNGELRSTYDILNDLAGKWDQLSSKQKQYFGEKVAGNRQVKTLNAIMQNWDVVSDTIDKANEATGAATTGNEKYLDSIQGRITAFKSAFQELATTTIDSGVIKWFVELGTSILNVTSDIGGFQQVLIPIVSILAVTKWNSIQKGIKGIGEAFKTLNGQVSGVRIGISAAIAAIGIAVSAYNAYKNQIKETRQADIDAGQAASQKAKSITESLSAYERLASITYRTADQEAEFQDTVSNLNKLLGDRASILEGLTAGTQDYSEALKSVTEEELKQLQLDALKAATAARKNAEDLANGDINPLNDIGRTSGYTVRPERPVNDNGRFDKIVSDLSNKTKTTTMYGLSGAQTYIEPLENNLSGILTYYNAITKAQEELLEAEKETGETFYTDTGGLYDSLSRSVEKYKSTIDEFLSTQYEVAYFDQFAKNGIPKTAEDADAIADSIIHLTNVTEDAIPIIKDYVYERLNLNNVGGGIAQTSDDNSEAGQQTRYSVSDLASENFIATESYKALTAAMTEQQKAGAITYETYQTLMSDEGLPGIAELLTLTAEGYTLNTEAVYDYIKAQNQDIKSNAIEEIYDMQKALEDLIVAREKLTDAEEIAANDSMQSQILSEIDSYAALIREIDSATDALSRYKAAKQTQNQDADFNEGQNAYKDIQEGLKTGKIGTDDFKSAVDFILGDNWQERFSGDLEQAYKEADRLGKRYFGQKDERTGMKTFMQDLEDKGLANYNNKTGELEILKDGDGQVLTLEEIASKLGIAEEAARSMFGLLESYGYEFEFPEVITDEEVEKIVQKKNNIEETTSALEQVNKKIEEVQGEIDSAGEGVDTSEAQLELENLQNTADTLKTHLDELNSGEEVGPEVDTMTLEEAKKKIDELSTTISTLNGEGINIPVSIAQEYNDLLKSFPELQDLTHQPITIDAKAGTGVETTTGKVEELKENVEKLDGVEAEPDAKLNDSQLNDKVKEDKGELEKLGDEETEPKVGIDDLEIMQTMPAIKEELQEIDNDEANPSVGANDAEIMAKMPSIREELKGLDKENVDPTINATDNASETISTAKENLESIPDEETTDLNANDQTATGISNAETNLSAFEENSYDATIDVGTTNLEETDRAIQAIADKPRNATITVEEKPVTGNEPDYVDNTHTDENGHVYGYSGVLPYQTRESNKGKDREIIAPKQEWQNNPKPMDLTLDVTADGAEEAEDDWARRFKEAWDAGAPLEAEIEAKDPETVIEDVQNVADANPVNITSSDVSIAGNAAADLIETSSNAEEARAAISRLSQAYYNLSAAQKALDEVDPSDTSAYETAANNLTSAASEFTEAYNSLASLSDETVQVDAETETALSKIQAVGEQNPTVNLGLDSSEVDSYKPEDKEGNVDYSVNTSKIDRWTPPVKKGTVQYQVKMERFAKGTTHAPNGPSLVDEEGQELIEHKRTGTFELGTNNGPRLTQLEKGDVVHTASETKRILSRLGKVGNFFRDGLNKTKSIFGNAFATGITGGLSSSLFSWKTVSSNYKKATKKKKSTKSSSKSSGSSRSSSSTSQSTTNPFFDWSDKLFDWAEIRLDRLKTITNTWLANAAEAIGYFSRNKELTSAISSVNDEIKATTDAYDLYIKQADTVAQKANLSDDLVKKIQQGEISIGEYDEDTRKKIEEYQEWYDKALQCVDVLQDLKEQERDLAKQKLDNIITHYNNRINRLDNLVKYRESQLALAAAQGRELQASEYDASIEATSNKLEELVAERDALKSEIATLLSQGLIEKESDVWYEYTSKLDDLEETIVDTKTAIIELYDTANQVSLTKLGYQLDALTNSASQMEDMMKLHAAQGLDEVADAYGNLIANGMSQILNLEEQNQQYREQQKGLDVLSDKYQELEKQIQSNISAINSMKVSQEGWNDSVLDLEIDKIEKYRDSLKKTNEQYKRQKELQEAIEELERAQGQRTQRIFKQDVGFVYEADQDEIKEAQEKLEGVIENQLLSRMDDLIDALNQQKNDTNVYDAQGNLLGSEYTLPQLSNLSDILSNYYNNPNNAPSIAGLRDALYNQIVSGVGSDAANKQLALSIGEINLNEVNSADEFANAIINQFPNALLQALYKK